MFSRGGEDAVEEILVAPPQGAAEGREQGFGFVQVLRDCDDGSAHGVSGKEWRLRYWLGKRFCNKEDFIGAIGQVFEQEGFFLSGVRVQAQGNRRGEREALDVIETDREQAFCFARRDLIVLKGRKQVEDDGWMTAGLRALQQMHDLISGEGAAQVDAVRCLQHIEAAFADLARDAIGGEAVPAVQHGHGSAQGEFRQQAGEKCRSAEGNGDSAGFEGGEDVHGDTIHGSAEIKNPPTGISWGNTLGEAGVGECAAQAANTGSRLPGAEVPLFEREPKFRTCAQVELEQNVAQVGLDGFGGDVQAQTDLLVGVSEADQRRHVSFTRGEGLPLIQQHVGRVILGKARGQQVMDQIVFGTPVVPGEGGQGHVHRFADLIFTAGGWGTQAYQRQQFAPDRHAGIISEHAFCFEVVLVDLSWL